MKKTRLLFSIFLFSIGVNMALAQVPAYVPTNGLVGWWPFNGNANDESGNGNNGTVNGATLTTDRFGNANKAYSFDGNDFISVPHNSSFNMSQATWNVWVKKNSASAGNGMYIFGKRDNAQHHLTFNEYLGSGNGSIGWASGQASGVGGNSIVGGWHMLTIVYNQSISSNNFVYYFDGIQIGTTTVNSFTFVNGDVRFGVEVNNFYWQGFNGFIDDALVYNRILSNCEILDLYNAQVNSFTTNAGSDFTKTCISNSNGAAIGTTTTSGQTYSWSPTTGLSSSSASNPIANPSTTTTYTLTTTNTANGCTATDQVLVTVNTESPTVNAGSDQTVCAGTSVTLSASGANTYAWDNNVSNGTAFTPAATNTYSVSGTDANGCSNTDQVLVTVNPLPNVNAGADQSICKGDAVTLSGTGASTYAWNNNVTNGVAFNPIATATYSVAGTDANGCTNADEVVVIVNEATASTLTESALDSYTLNGQTYTQSGTYTQVLTNAAGCDSTITLNLTLSFTGLNELAQGIQLFPNPANDVLNIQSSAALVGEYTLYDASGREVLRGVFTGALTKIDVRNIAPGTYTLQAAELMERIVVLR